MRVERQVLEGVTVVSVAEPVEIDISNSDQFKSAAMASIGEDRVVVLDASFVEFFDSAGMAALLSLQKRMAQRHGKLVLAGLNRSIQEIFRMVGFDVVFETFQDVPVAVEALKS